MSGFGRQYTQIYGLLYSLQYAAAEPESINGDVLAEEPEAEEEFLEEEPDRTRRIYQAYPWRGGYSAVNFYQVSTTVCQRNIGHARIVRIEYASPGFIELEAVS